MDKDLQKGILENKLDQNEFICKACFKKRLIKKSEEYHLKKKLLKQT